MTNKATSLKVLGIMSGTSLDGLDMALCRFQFGENLSRFEITRARTLPYPQGTEALLRNAEDLPANELIRNHFEYGAFIGRSAREFLRSEPADLLASHGHTVFHRPDLGYTFQLGHGGAAAKASGITTVADFRTQDILLGGQGAPLVPVGDKLLFHKYKACLNLGGFANISVSRENEQPALDICPVNFVLNRFARQKGEPYDAGGAGAQSGKVIPELARKLEQLPYPRTFGKGSLGSEWVKEHIDPLLSGFNDCTPDDLLRTFCEHQTDEIARAANELLNLTPVDRILATGGGVKNTFFVDLLREKCAAEIVVPDPLIIDFKEALIFALMGALRFNGLPNVLPESTGASKEHCSGIIFKP